MRDGVSIGKQSGGLEGRQSRFELVKEGYDHEKQTRGGGRRETRWVAARL